MIIVPPSLPLQYCFYNLDDLLLVHQQLKEDESHRHDEEELSHTHYTDSGDRKSLCVMLRDVVIHGLVPRWSRWLS